MPTTAFLQNVPGTDHRGPVIIDGLTASGTAGTRNTVAHGLGFTPSVVIPIVNAADADGSLTAAHDIRIVSIGATNIVTRGAVASTTYSLICFP